MTHKELTHFLVEHIHMDEVIPPRFEEWYQLLASGQLGAGDPMFRDCFHAARKLIEMDVLK